MIATRQEETRTSYSLSHEVMVAEVRKWFDEREIECNRAEETLKHGLTEWNKTQALLNEKQVQKIRQWLTGESLGTEAEELLTKSQQDYEAQQRKEAEQERRIRRNRTAFQMALGIGLVIAVILTTITFWQRNVAVKEKIESDRRAMVSLAQSIASQAPRQQIIFRQDERAALLARQAYLLNQHYHGQALSLVDDALRSVLSQPYFHMTLTGHKGRVGAVVFSPDGQTLAGSGDETVRLWRVADPTATPTILRGHEKGVEAVAFSPDGQTLASGSGDGTVRLWRVADPTAAPVILTGHKGRVEAVAFSLDGQTLASGSWDETVRLWLWPTERLADRVCQLVRRNLTWDEWQQFVSPDIPYERTCSNLPGDVSAIFAALKGKTISQPRPERPRDNKKPHPRDR